MASGRPSAPTIAPRTAGIGRSCRRSRCAMARYFPYSMPWSCSSRPANRESTNAMPSTPTRRRRIASPRRNVRLADRWVAPVCGRRPRARLTRPHAPPHGVRPAAITLAGPAPVAGPVSCAVARRLDQTIRQIPALLAGAAGRALLSKRGTLAKRGVRAQQAAAPAAGLRPSGPGASGPPGVRCSTARASAWATAGPVAPLSATASLVVSARQLPVPPTSAGIPP